MQIPYQKLQDYFDGSRQWAFEAFDAWLTTDIGEPLTLDTARP